MKSYGDKVVEVESALSFEESQLSNQSETSSEMTNDAENTSSSPDQNDGKEKDPSKPTRYSTRKRKRTNTHEFVDISDDFVYQDEATDSFLVSRCPDVLVQMFSDDFRRQDESLGDDDIERMISLFWRDLKYGVRKTMPIPDAKHYAKDLREWKIRMFGEITLMPPSKDSVESNNDQAATSKRKKSHTKDVKPSIPGCPPQLVDLFWDDFKRQDAQSNKVRIRMKIAQLWEESEESIIKSLPKPGNSKTYTKELTEWKIQHFGKMTRIPRSHLDKEKPEKKQQYTRVQEQVATAKKVTRTQSNDKAEITKNITPTLQVEQKEGPSTPRRTRTRKRQSTEISKAEEKKEEKFSKTTPSKAQNVSCSVHQPSSFFKLVNDPNDFYIEEEAHLYHNPPIPSLLNKGVEPGDLKAIPPPFPIPKTPNTGKCKWTYDEDNRIMLADFSASTISVQGNEYFVMDPKDESFFLAMLERDDITVISEGLISQSNLKPEYWKLEYLQNVLKQEYYHQFRRFDTLLDENGLETCLEVDGMCSMRIGEYVEYLKKRQAVLTSKKAEDRSFLFIDHLGRPQKIEDVGISAIYMIDLDINKLLPKLHANFLQGFRYPEILPGGDHCMMNSVTDNARPYMGPNMYVTPPAAFTHFHQDGHGTVDSGHLCLAGYNEVVILRRLTERHKKHALMILTGDGTPNGYFDGLYQEPHQDQLGKKPSWPTQENIGKCRAMGYCPSLCIVKPGQLIHINKGRLHAFRKMSTAPLPKHDCHNDLRKALITERNIQDEELCISIAWDWMYRGITDTGINREVCTMLEAVTLNRKMGKISLAVPELCLLQMAKTFPPSEPSVPTELNSMLGFGNDVTSNSSKMDASRAITICRGILPGLRHILRKQAIAMKLATHSMSKSTQRGKRVSISKRPNTHEDSMCFPVDPYGNNDFMCKLCAKELSNLYYHCDGCEKLLSKDFNICQQCHSEKRFMETIQMHPSKTKRHSLLNHTGNMLQDRASRCPCKNGPCCEFCGYCSGCSCRCHTWFTLHCRFFNEEESEVLLDRVERAAHSGDSKPNKYLDDSSYLSRRLELATSMSH